MSGAPEKVKKSKRRSEKRIEGKRNQRRKCGNICVRLIFCGTIVAQKIRRSRDSILSSEANHVIRRRRLAYFYSFCTSLKMKK